MNQTTSITATILCATLMTGCGPRTGLDLSTTPSAQVMILATTLQKPEVKETIGEYQEIYLVKSESMQSRSWGSSRSSFDDTFYIVGNKDDLLVQFRLESKNGKDFKVTDYYLMEPEDRGYKFEEHNRVEFENLDFGEVEEK